MKRCVLSGALAARAALCAVFIVTGLAVTFNEAASKEFANVLGAGSDDAKKASVEALDALSKVFAAIKTIEEEGPNAGRDALSKAAEQLYEAGKLMAEVKLDPSVDLKIDYERLTATDKVLLETSILSLAPGLKTAPATLNTLYGGFTEATIQIASELGKLSTTDAPVLPAIGDKLATYIQLGGAVSRAYTTFQKQ